ncbi:non-ribosomal peptide synthetase [Streptomyces sp. RLB1-33]|nr:non-ribosomal peptide synthetase [Streptomyces sp. RLB1-33]
MPTVAGLAARLDAAGTKRAPLVAGRRPDRLPASFAQQRLWFLNQFEDRLSPTYNVPVALRLTGTLDPAALRTALADVVARHETLRTVFAEDAEGPYQRILEPLAPSLGVEDATADDLDARLAAAARTGFDLATDIPLRARLFALAPHEHVLLLVMHHIAGDGGWSMPLLVQDLATAYAARSGGAAPAWRPLTVQYADYTLWQQDVLGTADDPSSELARQLDHWRTALAGLPEASLARAAPLEALAGEPSRRPSPRSLTRSPRRPRPRPRQHAAPTGRGAEIRSFDGAGRRRHASPPSTLLFAFADLRAERGAPDGLSVRLEYSTDLFDDSTADRFAACLLRVLRAVAVDAERPVHRIDVLDEAERALLLTAVNETALPREAVSLAEAFAAQAARTPDGVAVTADGTSLTFRQVDTAAEALAAELIRRGAAPEEFVAVALPRGADLVVTLVAVLKTGAAYVPVDPYYPAERIGLMLADTAPRVVVTTSALAAELPLDGVDRFLLDEEPPPAAAPVRAVRPVRPEHPAYVIYTSGSTGRPKGILMPGRALTNLLAWHERAVPGEHGTVVAQFTAVGFDVSVQEMLFALLTGRTLAVCPEDVRRDPVALARWLERERVAELYAPNLVIDGVLEAARECGADLSVLRHLVQAGEALTLSEPVRAHHGATATRLHNHYGPAETHVVTGWTLPADVADWPGTAPIGLPVDNTRVYVLDTGLLPVAPGVTGELHLAGDNLARGYHARPGLTSERFVADPYGPPGTRMYRTGDLVRWTRSGLLEYVGRSDDQVKIRGFRIEPGEVEAALAGLPEVRRCAVVVREDAPGDKRLVAYAVPAPGADLDPARLRTRLSASLPDHLVPSAIVPLPDLPLTPNGKLDRRALPAPDHHAPAPGRAPRSPQEEILCGLFAEVLRVPAVGIDDDFFDRGGHSLLATRLASRIRSTLGVEISVRRLFETPTVAGVAALLREADGARDAVRQMPRPERLPLSYAQQRLWFLDQMDGPSTTYNLANALRLSGELDVVALRQALADVVARHESLRTVFAEDAEGPHQVILDDVRPEIHRVPCTEEELPERIAAATAHGFDLAQGIPLRVTLFELGESEHALLILLHHIAGDGWSLPVLVRDVAVAYGARVGGAAPAWTQLPVQYADFALWQRDLLGDESDEKAELVRQLEFWKTALEGVPQELALPADRSRPAAASYRGDRVPLTVSPELHTAIAELAAAHRVSVFMVMQAAVAVLLHRLGAGDDIPLGSPVAGRTDDALEELVGFFVNTLVLRTDVSGDPSFAELLDRIRETDLAAFAHQDVPFERVVEAVNPSRSMVRHPLFQTMLMWDNTPATDGGSLPLGGLDARAVPAPAGGAKVDLTFTLTERRGGEGAPAGLVGALEFAEDLFDRGTAERFAEWFVRLLEQAVADPDTPVATLRLTTEKEAVALVASGTATPETLPEGTFVEWVAEAVRRSPDATAVETGDEALTFGELDTAANRLAHELRTRGVGPESFVAVSLPRSTDLVVALLATLRTGAAYIPLDPDQPADRTAFMLTDAAPTLLLTSRSTDPAAGTGLPRLYIDETDVSRHPATDATVAVPGTAAAYVIYTSGSTGRPKGVVVPRAAVTNFLHSMAERCAIGNGDRLAAVTTIGFDISVLELFLPLVTGATVVLVARDTVLDPARLAVLVRAERDRPGSLLMQATPGLWRSLLDTDPTAVRDVRVLVGGEALPPDLADTLTAAAVSVNNLYGPTETTVWSTASEVTEGEAPDIGGPLANTSVYVLDARLQMLPVGVPGELYVAGTGVARGYHARPGLTASRFVADPFGPTGSRMYRTGDIAQRRTDGHLDYLGRTDDQTKIRGFRIEPGEIETALLTHPHVRRAAVTVREDTPGDKRLIAYVVTDPTTDTTTLRAHTSHTLPDYMIPSAVIPLDTLPLTPSGKLDRKALPAPVYTTAENSRDPRTPHEELLRDLFADTLGIPHLGIDDNFFDLGGHSLLAAKIVGRIRERLGTDLTVRAVFSHPTVARLAAHLDDSAHTAAPARPALRKRSAR